PARPVLVAGGRAGGAPLPRCRAAPDPRRRAPRPATVRGERRLPRASTQPGACGPVSRQRPVRDDAGGAAPGRRDRLLLRRGRYLALRPRRGGQRLVHRRRKRRDRRAARRRDALGLPRRAPVQRGGGGVVADDVARRRTPVLVVAPVRLPPPASGRDGDAEGPRPLRKEPAPHAIPGGAAARPLSA